MQVELTDDQLRVLLHELQTAKAIMDGIPV